jgi:hypothetical protein
MESPDSPGGFKVPLDDDIDLSLYAQLGVQ